MAMEKLHVIKETHFKQITALAFNPLKHEIVAGCEDGIIKSWDCSGEGIGKLTKTCHEHAGWVNCFLFWSDAKLFLSAANDGKLIAWGSNMLPVSINKVGLPVYIMALNHKRCQIVLGVNGGLRVHNLCEPASNSGKVFTDKAFVANDHTDIVKGVVCCETRIYSAGYDRRICVYDSYALPGKKGLKLVTSIYPAHDAGITKLVLAQDDNNNTWLLTGAFDKSVKVWSQDGQLLHKFDGMNSSVTGMCYVEPSKTVWVAAGTPVPPMFDLKSGNNVSEFVGTFERTEKKNERCSLLLLHYISELNMVVANNIRRQILIWKHNAAGCITSLKHKSGIECLTYTKKVPILVFTGCSMGELLKWERSQSNTFMYSLETLPQSEFELARQRSKRCERQNNSATRNENKFCESSKAVTKLVFVEELDLLLVASEDRNIYVWGFDHATVQVLQEMKPKEDALSNKFASLLQKKIPTEDKKEPAVECDSVTNRVAGFICRAAFVEHSHCVSSLAVVGRSAGYNTTYLISADWDKRIFVWDLEKLRLHDRFRHSNDGQRAHSDDVAADGVIVDMVYCEESDKLVYIRQFSEQGDQMKLKAILQGHEAEVTKIRWNGVHQKWISGCEDGFIRIWSADGCNCESQLATFGCVNDLCIDVNNGCVLVAVQDTIKVFDIETKTVVQINRGHTDVVRGLIHIPERDEYVSASWDKTVRVWNAYKQETRNSSNMLKVFR